MSARRTWSLAGIWVTTLVGYLATQSAFQEAETQVESANQETEKPSYTERSQEEYAPDRIILKLEEGATRSDLEELNQQNDASAEKDLLRGNVNVVELPQDLLVEEQKLHRKR